jgi:hypothetical protein
MDRDFYTFYTQRPRSCAEISLSCTNWPPVACTNHGRNPTLLTLKNAGEDRLSGSLDKLPTQLDGESESVGSRLSQRRHDPSR